MDGCFYSRRRQTGGAAQRRLHRHLRRERAHCQPVELRLPARRTSSSPPGSRRIETVGSHQEPLINQVSVDLPHLYHWGRRGLGEDRSGGQTQFTGRGGDELRRRRTNLDAHVRLDNEEAGEPAVAPHGAFRAPPPAGSPMHTPSHWDSVGYLDAIDWQSVSGGLDLPGPGTVWAEPKVPLVDDEPAYGVPLLLLVADAATGVSSFDDPQELMLINTDLSLSRTARAGRGSDLDVQRVLDRPRGHRADVISAGRPAGSWRLHISPFRSRRESLGFGGPHPHIQTDL